MDALFATGNILLIWIFASFWIGIAWCTTSEILHRRDKKRNIDKVDARDPGFFNKIEEYRNELR